MAAAEIQLTDICRVADTTVEDDSVKPEVESEVEEGKCKRMKKPRRVLHFSDGTLEEYSTDEEEEEQKKPDNLSLIEPKSLRWGPWMYYWMLYSGSSALAACDYIGEGLANILGITTPKYQYEIDEYKRSEEEEMAEKENEAAEMAGWTSTDAASPGDGIRHKILNSPTLSQAPGTEITHTQVTTESETGEETGQGGVLDAAHDSARWDRF